MSVPKLVYSGQRHVLHWTGVPEGVCLKEIPGCIRRHVRGYCYGVIYVLVQQLNYNVSKVLRHSTCEMTWFLVELADISFPKVSV